MPKPRSNVLGLSAAVALRAMGTSLYLPVFALYGRTFTDSALLVGLAFGAQGFVQAALEIPYGVISDRVGRKRLIVLGNLCFITGSIICALASGILMLILGRAIQGAGSATSALLAFVADTTGARERTRAMGQISIFFSLAFLGGVVLGPTLGAHFGIRALFWGAALIGALTTLYIIFSVHELGESRRGVELKQFGGLFRNREVVRASGSVLIATYASSSMFLLLPLLLRVYLPMGEFWKFLLPVVGLGVAAVAVLSRYADRGRQRTTLLIAFVLLFIGGVLPTSPGYLSLFVGYVAFFMGFATAVSVLASILTLTAPAGRVGLATGFYNVAQASGYFLGGTVTGFLIQWSDEIALGVLALLVLGGTALGLGFPRTFAPPARS
ncbi:MAG: MFS transporter [Deltaproteobacteria bacterium]|nr:MFS transporter [Deltaproteobacteria bacterium]